MKKTVLRNYARLIARMGINVQKGQGVIITAELDQPEFVTMVVEECYRAGAGEVRVEWHHDPLTKLHYRHCKQKVLDTINDWEIEKIKHRVATLPAMIYLTSEDPDGMVGINQKKFMQAMQKRSAIIKPYRNQMADMRSMNQRSMDAGRLKTLFFPWDWIPLRIRHFITVLG